jgi:transcriptional regulator with XRE-family HTH domain
MAATSKRTLGSIIRQLRGPRPQHLVASEIGVTQSALSAWELDKVIPSEQHLQAFAAHVGADAEQLEREREIAADRGGQKGSLERVVSEARSYFKKHPDETFKIWVLGGESLPVVEDASIRDFWIENLVKGHSYRMVCALDLIPPATMRSMLPNFAELARSLEDEVKSHSDRADDARPPGRIEFYPIHAHCKPREQQDKIYGDFLKALSADKLSAFLKAHPHPAGDDYEALQEAVHDLMQLWTRSLSMVVYQPEKTTTPPIANVRLMPVSDEMPGSYSGSVWRPTYWLGPAEAGQLTDLMQQLTKAFRVENETGPPRPKRVVR